MNWERLIVSLALLSVVVVAWGFGWLVGLIAFLGIAIGLHESKLARNKREWREKWEAKEALHRAGDRR